MMKIILASASPRRRELLQQIGLKFEVIPARGEEIITKTVPSEIVCELSMQKAKEVAALKEGQMQEDGSSLIVIGADTVVCQDGKVMGKPSDRDHAIRMLEKLQGRKHSVYTGVTVLVMEPGQEIVQHTFFAETKVEVYPMERREIEAYADTGDPMDKAGAYGIQGCFAAWVKGIEGDYNNVVGLPVSALWQILKDYEMEE